MNIKSFVLTLTMITTSQVVCAQMPHDAHMQQVAQRQMQAMGLASKAEKLQETATLAIYGSNNGGFVVMNKQAEDHAVLGYSTSKYDALHQPCGFRWWLKAIDESLRENNGMRRSAGFYQPVKNFMRTTWGQDAPYNQYCPEIHGEKAPCGCIATSMAQVMRMYEWPDKGLGMGMYTVSGSNTPVYEEVNSTYNWSIMPNVPLSSATKSTIRKAVGTLLFDCGRAVKMNYTLQGSGAYDFDQALALARTFKYDSLMMRRMDRELFTDDEWMEAIVGEMQAGRPILYCGSSEADGGHSFIFCGLDEDGKVYINWGWDGDLNGYYDVSDIKPTLKGEPVYDFTEGQSMIIGLQPMSENGSEGVYQSLFVGYVIQKAQVNRSGKKLELPGYYVYNAQFLPFVGIVGLNFESTDEQKHSKLIVVEDSKGEAVECYDGFANMVNNRFATVTLSVDNLPAGCYRVNWVSKAVEETNPQPMVGSDGRVLKPFYLSKDNSGRLQVSDQEITTDMIGVQSSHESEGKVYNLQGRQVSPQTKGLLISSGRKMLKTK